VAFQDVAKSEDIAPGQVKVFSVGRKSICLANVDGAFYAIDNLCTHDRGPLGDGELIGDQIECPRHGARFDVKTGKVMAFPAVVPVKAYKTEVVGDEVRVDVG
jgi:nitrite reductase/ring-hydroxylating ferredoxin subunit